MKKFAILGATLVLAVMLSACGTKSDNAGNAGAAAETSAAAAASLEIKARSWEFDKPEYHIKKGEATKLSLKSESGYHGLEIPDLNVKLTSGESTVITVNEAGTYEMHCDIPCGTGHTKMTTKLVVE